MYTVKNYDTKNAKLMEQEMINELFTFSSSTSSKSSGKPSSLPELKFLDFPANIE